MDNDGSADSVPADSVLGDSALGGSALGGSGPDDVRSRAGVITHVRAGIRDGGGVALGMIPIGLAFGVVVVTSGFAWWWAPIFSTIIYAGSAEFLALSLVLSGTGVASAAFSAFAVNFRHIFYGLTFPRDGVRSRVGRAYSTYALTDESYAIAASLPHPPSGPHLLAIQIWLQLMWVGSGVIGALITAYGLGTWVKYLDGVGFALTALFVVLAIEAFHVKPSWGVVAIASVIAVVAAVVVGSRMLLVALPVYFLLVLWAGWRERGGPDAG